MCEFEHSDRLYIFYLKGIACYCVVLVKSCGSYCRPEII